jgi:predicted enzyme related to lactoylglutathione lyase
MNMNQVTLPVNNIKKAVDFYLKLGFTQIVDSDHYARFVSSVGNATFSLSQQESTINHNAVIYFEYELLDQWVDELIAKGVEFKQMPTDMSYLWREAICFDPSGNKIKLYWAGENRLNPPWKVNITNN